MKSLPPADASVRVLSGTETRNASTSTPSRRVVRTAAPTTAATNRSLIVPPSARGRGLDLTHVDLVDVKAPLGRAMAPPQRRVRLVSDDELAERGAGDADRVARQLAASESTMRPKSIGRRSGVGRGLGQVLDQPVRSVVVAVSLRVGEHLERLLGVGRDVEERRRQAHAADAVGDRVVELGEQRRAAVVEVVDDAQLPQRPGWIERLGQERAGDVEQPALVVPAGSSRRPTW